ncbi:MAG: hypothetical protein HYS77_11715, partial [Candidatus Rokubacteria bacterium]|nr:hypothetical protein [Candidatus Rokubacteria bacterium]
MDAIVTFDHVYGAAHTAAVPLLIAGSSDGTPPPVLRLVGELEEPKISFTERKVDFGTQAIGIARERVVTLRNTGDVDGVVWFDSLPPGVTVAPSRGRV